MAIQSKYSNEELEKLLNEILLLLEQRNTPVDLSLMVLGNATTEILNRNVPAEHRARLAEQFATALRKSIQSV